MEETCKSRQENELQAIQAIYMDDFQDLREKVVLSWFDFWSGVYSFGTDESGVRFLNFSDEVR